MSYSNAEPVTIAIPFYAGLGYLREAIESVLAQEGPQWRLVVVDDASPEDAAPLVRSFSDARIRYERADGRRGMAGNWNRCLELATTDLVTLLHADDRLLPNYVVTMLQAAAGRPQAAAFFCKAKIIDAAGSPVFSLPDYVKTWLTPVGATAVDLSGEAGLAALLRGNFIMCPTLCYRRSQIGARRFRDDRHMVLDLAFTSQLLLEGLTLTGLPETAYVYRRHEASASSQHTRSLLRFEEELALYDELATAAAGRSWLEAAAVARSKRMIRLHLLVDTGKSLGRGDWMQAWRTMALMRQLSSK